MIAGSAEVIKIELNGYQIPWSKDNKHRTKYAKCAIDKAFKNRVWLKNQTRKETSLKHELCYEGGSKK